MDQLNFDRKIAVANENFNDKLLIQVRKEAARAARVSSIAQRAAKALRAGLKKQDKMDKVESALQAQKLEAQKAVERFTSEEQDAQKKVEAAEKAKVAADAEADKAAHMLKLAEERADSAPTKHHKDKAAMHIPAAERLANMVQYLRTALSHHNSISRTDLQIMQSFFLQHGGQMLSKIAQIEPDATWSDKGVVGTEQWAMDHDRPDQLSKEWGGKKVKGSTVIRDVVEHEMSPHESSTMLQRPGSHQAIQGLFGMANKLPLKFAPDHSRKLDKEPELGESMDDQVEELPQKLAFSSMMGIN
jgi:hypothetical protein